MRRTHTFNLARPWIQEQKLLQDAHSKQTAQRSMKKVGAGRAEKRDQGTWNLQHHCQQIGAAKK